MIQNRIYLHDKDVKLASKSVYGNVRTSLLAGGDYSEYLRLSRVWHPNTDLPGNEYLPLLIVLRDYQTVGLYHFPTNAYYDIKGEKYKPKDIMYWAYINELIPSE